MENRSVAIVTGAARRIGLAVAEGLAHEGYAVVLHASERSLAEAEAATSRLSGEGARATAVAADLADPLAPARIVAAAARLGPPSLLVNSASVFEADDAAAPDPALLERCLAVNLRAPLLLTAAFAEAAAGVEDACAVNILDQRVLRPNPLYFSYTVSKSALLSATRTMAQALAPRGVRVNAVAPGPTCPSRHHGDEGFRREVAGVPLRRAVDPAEILGAVLYLARAESVTGQVIAVDSGQHLGWETPDVLGYEGATET